jgi:acetyl-CoA carboxylase beta subunit
MAWWKKEKKSRAPRTEKLEIPPDAWEKCEACGHTDIREKFVRNLNVCPNCDFHRRIRAADYCNLLLDDGTMEEVEVDLRSTDPLGFPEYPARLKKNLAKAGEGDPHDRHRNARRCAAERRRHGLQLHGRVDGIGRWREDRALGTAIAGA